MEPRRCGSSFSSFVQGAVMIGPNPRIQPVSAENTQTRLIVQQQLRDIVAGLSPSTLAADRSGPAAVRVVAVGAERYRIVVDLLQRSPTTPPVPVATIERIETSEPAERRLRQRYRLTEKEISVALLLAQRRSNSEIADALRISKHTARRHTENVMLKLNVSSRYLVENALAAA
jgi:DNA-binding CsgD family transcriptional regulator